LTRRLVGNANQNKAEVVEGAPSRSGGAKRPRLSGRVPEFPAIGAGL
jgi:hypothetical protein